MSKYEYNLLLNIGGETMKRRQLYIEEFKSDANSMKLDENKNLIKTFQTAILKGFY